MHSEIIWTDFGKLCLDMTEEEREKHLTGYYKFEVVYIKCIECNGEGYYGPNVVITTQCQGYDDGYDFHMCENIEGENPDVYEIIIDDEIYTECCNFCIEKYKNCKAYKSFSISSKKIEPKIQKSFECPHCYSGFVRKFNILNGTDVIAETSCRNSAKKVIKRVISKKDKALLKLFDIHEEV